MANLYYKTKEENIKSLYLSIKSRVGKVGLYKNRKLLISWEDFYDFMLKDKEYNRIYKEWVKNDFFYLISPTIDRIENDRDYTIDNIQVLTRQENARKGQLSNNDFRKGYEEKNNEDFKLHLKDKRNEIILILKSQGYSNAQISFLFGVNRSTIKRITDKSVRLEEEKRYETLKDTKS